MKTLNLSNLALLIFFVLANSSCVLVSNSIGKDLDLEVNRQFNYEIESNQPDYNNLSGLDSILYHLKAPSLNIIITHGVKDIQSDHFEIFKKTLTQNLELTYVPASRQEIETECLDYELADVPSFQLKQYRSKNGKVVNIYDVNWSPVTRKIKELINNLDEDTYRSKVAKIAKEKVFIDVFADLAIYLSEDYKACIQQPVFEVLKKIAEPSTTSETVLIGGSFGNEIFLDVLDAKRDSPEKFSEKFSGKFKLKRIYMLSNQLPFTSLMSLPDTLIDSEAAFKKHLYKKITTYNTIYNQNVEIVNFYDPNDVFGYKLPNPEDTNLKIYNVKVQNTSEWSLNSEKLRDNYLKNLKGELGETAAQTLLNQSEDRQTLKVNILGPNSNAKKNLSIIGCILQGSNYRYPIEHFNVIKYRSDPAKLESIEVKVLDKERAEAQGIKDTLLFLKKNKEFFIKKWVGSIIQKGLIKRIKAVELTNSHLEYELPSKEIGADKIKGIEQSIAQNQITTVLTMHGMRNKAPDHFDALMAGVVAKLGFFPTIRRDSLYFVEPFDTESIAGNSTIRVVEFINGDKKILRFFILYWSPLTYNTKQYLQQIDDEVLKKEDVSIIVELLKKFIINDGFSDVELALNNFNPSIHRLIHRAFDLIQLKDPFLPRSGRSTPQKRTPNKDTYFVLGSLGSKLIMDYITNNIETKKVQYLLNNHLEQIFMLTNQLSLISLKTLDKSVQKDDFINHIYGKWKDKSNIPLKIVAFNDPNDILSFRLPVDTTSSIQVQNISLNIAKGIELSPYYATKLIKTFDKIIRKFKGAKELRRVIRKLKAQKKKSNNQFILLDEYISILQKDRDRMKHLLISSLHNYIEENKLKQDVVIRMDVAHEGASDDDRVFEILANGLKNIKRTSTPELKPPNIEGTRE